MKTLLTILLSIVCLFAYSQTTNIQNELTVTEGTGISVTTKAGIGGATGDSTLLVTGSADVTQGVNVGGNIMITDTLYTSGSRMTGTATTTNKLEIGSEITEDEIAALWFHGEAGADYDAIIKRNAGTNALFIIANTGTSDMRIQCEGAADMVFYTTNTIRGKFLSTGEFGVGNITPGQLLDVNGNARFRSIGSAASAGALHYTATGVLTTNTSDKRLKENIVILTDSITEKINSLVPVSYTWKDTTIYDTKDSASTYKVSFAEKSQLKKQYGFIAQDVIKTMPEIIGKNNVDGFYYINEQDMIPYLVKYVQLLEARIKQLEGK